MSSGELEEWGPPAPRENPGLFGHEGAEQTLLRAYRSGRLPHAWLFSGPRGIGKATLAYRFARFVLNDQAAVEAGPSLFGDLPPAAKSLAVDPASEVFRRVAAASHPDLRSLEIGADPKSGRLRREIIIDDVRQIGHFFRMTSAEGGWRIAVVDAIDSLNRNAANALLKILEEPPAKALLLLVSHAPGGLMATIRSRCCQVHLSPMPDNLVLDLMARHAPEVPEAERQAIVRLADGSIGRALALAEAEGLALYGELLGLLQDLPRLDVPRLHAFGDRLARSGDETAFQTGTDLLVLWLARLIRSGAEHRTPAEIVAGEGALLARLTQAPGSLARWLPLWDKITALFAQADAVNLDRKQVVLSAFLELQAAAPRG